MYFSSLFFVELVSREGYDSLQISKPYIGSSLKDFELLRKKNQVLESNISLS